MTQAEKAKCYDEAIINGLRLWECGLITREAYENIFPELRNKDEEIRQGLIELVKQSSEILEKKNQEQMIAWLEKQDEENIKNKYIFKSIPRLLEMIEPTDRAREYCKKLIDSLLQEGYITDAKIVSNCLKQMNDEKVAMATMDEQDPNDVKPKFHEGDWAACNDDNFRPLLKIVSISDKLYTAVDIQGVSVRPLIEYLDKHYHLFTLQDVNDGDVLAFDDDTIVIFKDLYNATSFHSYCHIEDGVFNISKIELPDWWNGVGFKPATKEQRDILFTKMYEAGYEWDAERKELKRI